MTLLQIYLKKQRKLPHSSTLVPYTTIQSFVMLMNGQQEFESARSPPGIEKYATTLLFC